MLVHAGLTQTVFDTPLPPGSPWWAVVLILIVSVITFVIRQSMTNRTASLETNLRLALQKQHNDFQLKMEAMLKDKAQDTANANAIQTLATTLSQAVTGLQDTVRTFAEERREATQAIKENTEVYRRANAVAEQQNQKIDDLLQQMKPLTSAIPDAVSSIVQSFNQTEQSLLAAVERTMDIGIVIIGKDETISAYNPQAAKLFGAEELPERIPKFVRMYTFPGRDVIPRSDWICNRVLSERRSSYAIAGVTGANRETVWLWIIAEPHGADAVRLALLDATDAVRALKHIDEETKRITDEILTPST